MAVIATAALLTVFLTGQEGSPQHVALVGIDVKELESANIKLFVPDGTPKIGAEQAQEAVNSGGNPFGLPVQQVELARLVQEGPDGPYRDKLVWVVVLGDGTVHQMDAPGPATDPGDGTPISYSYSLAVVDAMTGEFIFATFGPLPPNYSPS
jgi:hypothetical protein